jgi:hypothetical protein
MDQIVMEKTFESVKRFKESSNSVKGKIHENFTITEDFF